MAKFDKPSDINLVWASSGSLSYPNSSGSFTANSGTYSVQEGWTQVKPPYEIENWIQNQQSQFSAYINQLGIPEWDSSTEYQANKSYVQGSNNVVYKCISTHTGRNPASGNTSYWEVFEGNRQATTSKRGSVTLATSSQVQNASGGDAVIRSSDASVFQNASNLSSGTVPSARLSSASTTSKGIVELATGGEVQSGSSSSKVITPSSLATLQASTSLSGLVKLATSAEAEAGVSSSAALTPFTMVQGILGEADRSNNGYLEIPCSIGGVKRNMIVQWGGASNPVDGQGVFFSKPFPTTVLQVIPGLDQDSVSINSNDRASVKDIGAIQFKASVSRESSGNMVLRYIAIGY